jgi:hypothetical protein
MAHEGANRSRPVQEHTMPKTYTSRQDIERPARQQAAAQDRMQIVAEEPISDTQREEIGDLGNAGDGLDGIDALLEDMAARPPTRMALLMHRVRESLRALRALGSREAPPWPESRVPEEHWRALADEALGLIGGAARRELEEQRLIQAMPTEERESFQALCDSRHGLDVFRKGFEQERKAWAQAYWKRALDESFGKRPWQGPTRRGAGQ